MRSSVTKTAGHLAMSLLCLMWTLVVQAGDFSVIVNKDNAAAVDKATVTKIFTGEMKHWPDGTAVTAIDLPEDNAVRVSFTSEVLGKTVSNIKAMWSQMIFSGKALPPTQAATDDDVKKLVSANKGAIGYVKAASVDASVKAAVLK